MFTPFWFVGFLFPAAAIIANAYIRLRMGHAQSAAADMLIVVSCLDVAVIIQTDDFIRYSLTADPEELRMYALIAAVASWTLYFLTVSYLEGHRLSQRLPDWKLIGGRRGVATSLQACISAFAFAGTMVVFGGAHAG